MNKSGILKSKSNYAFAFDTTRADFLVFGYHCKLYRDDAKALEIDREGHLIPAPYDTKEMISRYDVRATLSDITPYEASSSYVNRLDGLSPAEQQAEMLAEEERYYSLYRNEVEEELYKEEKQKRDAATAYSQVQFNYDEDMKEIGPKESSEVAPTENDENDDTPFTPSENLNLPTEIEAPTTVKTNQIIEKTAKFISSQGPQMEILLKAKQAGNPQFVFLNHDGQYNSYYKHILSMMKNNTYPWQKVQTSDDVKTDSNENSNSNEENSTTPQISNIVIPKLQYKPSADCTYTQLISKITKAPIAELEKKNEEERRKENSNGVEIPKISSGLLGLVNYDSDTDEDESSSYDGPLPPSDIQIVIDKTAVYVAKNGIDFEKKLMCKEDNRFLFLHESNEYHKYYKMKVNSYMSNSPADVTINSSKSVEVKKDEIILPKVPPAPVSFSIKIKEERLALKNTMNISDDENRNNSETAIAVPEAPSPPRITTVEEELERQVDIINAEREQKLAKDRLNDKLLSAAREKLGMLPKEKMLQIERKKKAMMFINQIKGSNGSSSNSVNKIEDNIVNLTNCADDSDDKSVSSIKTPPNKKKREKDSSRSRSRRRSSSSRSRSSSRTSKSSSYSSRSSEESSSKRKHSKKSHKKRKYRRSKSKSPSRKRRR